MQGKDADTILTGTCKVEPSRTTTPIIKKWKIAHSVLLSLFMRDNEIHDIPQAPRLPPA